MRAKEIAHVRGGCKTGGKKVVQAKAAKRKSAVAMAEAAENRAMQALGTKRKRTDPVDDDELEQREEGVQEEEEDQGEEEEEEESGEFEEHESQGATSQGEPKKSRRPRSKVLIIALPLNSRILPDVIRESAR